MIRDIAETAEMFMFRHESASAGKQSQRKGSFVKNVKRNIKDFKKESYKTQKWASGSFKTCII